MLHAVYMVLVSVGCVRPACVWDTCFLGYDAGRLATRAESTRFAYAVHKLLFTCLSTRSARARDRQSVSAMWQPLSSLVSKGCTANMCCRFMNRAIRLRKYTVKHTICVVHRFQNDLTAAFVAPVFVDSRS